MNDSVEQPKHYEVVQGVEAIDLIRKMMSPEEFRGYCLGNVIKYRMRAGEKDDAAQDLAKSRVYAKWYNECIIQEEGTHTQTTEGEG